jgi:hypothetical protein
LTNGLHEIKKLLHNKRNGDQIEAAAHRMGENLFIYHKGLITRIYREHTHKETPQKSITK